MDYVFRNSFPSPFMGIWVWGSIRSRLVAAVHFSLEIWLIFGIFFEIRPKITSFLTLKWTAAPKPLRTDPWPIYTPKRPLKTVWKKMKLFHIFEFGESWDKKNGFSGRPFPRISQVKSDGRAQKTPLFSKLRHFQENPRPVLKALTSSFKCLGLWGTKSLAT